MVHLDGLREGLVYLLGGQGGEAGPFYANVTVLLQDDVQRLDADELALPVVVGGYDDIFRLPGKVA